MSLIDGVITAGSQFGVQCLQAVTNLTGIATGVGNASFGSAADLASWAKSSGNLSSTPQLGDIAVWGGGQGGALSAGHAGIVTGLTNGTQVTSTNWPAGSGEAQYTVGTGNNPIGMGNPLGFIDPTVLGGKNIITGATGTTATLTSANTGGLQSLNNQVPGGSSGTQSLGQLIGDVPGGGLPVVGGVIKGASAPFVFVDWVSQKGVWGRALFIGLGVVLAWYGLHLLTKERVPSPVNVIGDAGKTLAA